MIKPMVLTSLIGAAPAVALAQGDANADPTPPRWFMPEGASNHADHIDFTMHFINGVTVFFFVLIIALMLYFAIKYRRRSPHERARSQLSHHTALELSWSLPPGIVVIFMFYLGFQGFMDFDRPPGDAYEIRVQARTWSWTFTHPNGYTSEHLHVPAGQNVRLVMNSHDVLHSLYVPTFRVKRDVVPGKYTQLWFNARGITEGADERLDEWDEAELDELLFDRVRRGVEARRELEAQEQEDATEQAMRAAIASAGPAADVIRFAANAQGNADDEQMGVEEATEQRLAEMSRGEKQNLAMVELMERLEAEEAGHILYCTEYCGTLHSQMTARVIVHPPDWVAPEPVLSDDPRERGLTYFRRAGCDACHQLPGQDPQPAAPSFAEGIFGQQREMADGRTLEADREYLRRSVVDPMADVTAGYPPVMPPGLITDEDQLDDVIEFLIALPEYMEDR